MSLKDSIHGNITLTKQANSWQGSTVAGDIFYTVSCLNADLNNPTLHLSIQVISLTTFVVTHTIDVMAGMTGGCTYSGGASVKFMISPQAGYLNGGTVTVQ